MSKPDPEVAKALTKATAGEKVDLRQLATGLLANAGITNPGDMIDRILRMLRGDIALDISEQRITCNRHRVPDPASCPCCAWNTALLRAGRIANGHQVASPGNTWPPTPGAAR